MTGPAVDEAYLEGYRDGRADAARETQGSRVTRFAVALLDVPTHRHGPRGRPFIAYDDAVRVFRDLERTADSPPVPSTA